jgi:hypothetical protein
VRITRATVAALLVAVATGCGTTTLSPTAQPTTPAAPAVPDSWQVVTSPSGDVRVAAPADLGVIEVPDGVLLQGHMVAGVTPVQIWATDASDAWSQPAAGDSLAAWLRASGWLPSGGSGGVTETADESERVVFLPAGRALEVSVIAQPDTPEPSRVIAYAIETADGFAVLQIVGHPAVFEDRSADLSLITRLVSFEEDP